VVAGPTYHLLSHMIRDTHKCTDSSTTKQDNISNETNTRPNNMGSTSHLRGMSVPDCVDDPLPTFHVSLHHFDEYFGGLYQGISWSLGNSLQFP